MPLGLTSVRNHRNRVVTSVSPPGHFARPDLLLSSDTEEQRRKPGDGGEQEECGAQPAPRQKPGKESCAPQPEEERKQELKREEEMVQADPLGESKD